MDLASYGRVLLRFWGLMLAGIVLAGVLAVLSVARISSHGVKYRTHEVWQSQTLMLLTQPGFPWGRAVLPSGTATSSSPYADPTRFGNLTDLYSQFANSDTVRATMRREGAPKSWLINAAPAPSSNPYSGPVPVIALSGQAYSPRAAVSAAVLGREAFLQYVTGQQQAAAIPNDQRVVISVLKNATKPVLIQPRKKTLPIVIVLAILTLTVGLVLVLENVRPRPPVALVATGTIASRNALASARHTI